jgi:hypothetical protein
LYRSYRDEIEIEVETEVEGEVEGEKREERENRLKKRDYLKRCNFRQTELVSVSH